MNWIHQVSYFFGGLFLANAVPHFVSGVMGKPFQTPFAKPPGKGLSSSTVNVLWGFVNLVFAYLLLLRVGHFDPRSIACIAPFAAGVLLISLFSARHFGELHGGNTPERPLGIRSPELSALWRTSTFACGRQAVWYRTSEPGCSAWRKTGLC